ncbi:helix-turn-helix domain-containing protein [Chitinophaga sp. Hz27]|uniref:helix-turn-helix domain-containing protein n=1 Tax=Chitinophaga sp. Hz27 TaxID=3347169 RepID=UPI0035DB57B8
MNIVTIEPPHYLKTVVKKCWYANIQHTEHQNKSYKILADGAPGIVFQHCNGESSLVNTDGYQFPISFVYGQKDNSPCVNSFQGNPFIFGVDLQPTALKKLFAINASAITNSIVESEHLFSKEFIDQLLHAPSPQQIAQLFHLQLCKKLLKSKQDKIIDHSIKLIFEDTKGANSHDLSTRFHISRRQYQRKFKEHLGVSPESYMRIIKFQKSLHLLKTKQYSKLSDIGFSLNYADQSHFVREFKLFSNCTPKEFLSKIQSIQSFHPQTFETMRIISN